MRKLSISLKQDLLADYVTRQVNFFYPDNSPISTSDISICLSYVLNKIEVSFSQTILPYYIKDGNSWFNHLNGDHYAAFLYLLSNKLYQNGNEDAASKVFLLNKALFGIDAFYKLELPPHFIFVHPVGTILGRAVYDDFFVVYQGVTIGANREGVYPVFKPKTVLYSNSSIIGECKTGTNFILGANSSLIDSVVDDNKVVVGGYPHHRILKNKNQLIHNFYN